MSKINTEFRDIEKEMDKINSKITKLLNKYKMTSKDKELFWEFILYRIDYEIEAEKFCGV